MAGVVSPIGISNMTKFSALPPGSNNEPVLLPEMSASGMNTIVAINARTNEPVVVDTQANVTSMKSNAYHSMASTEKYINSGRFLPNGLEKQYPGSANIFTVKFAKQ